ncbi:hypothetical protein ACIGN6_31480 [Streptomyces sp. NPDC053792]|uniref:hypothetical protein n=1 Tax=Streptomyces sp. NPDC053792 TaxID=3365716 RepID=UPI0037D56869
MTDTAPTPAQRVALFAVVHCVRAIPKALANDPATAVAAHGDVAAGCAIITSAFSEVGPLET